jgi:hypothetical protein
MKEKSVWNFRWRHLLRARVSLEGADTTSYTNSIYSVRANQNHKSSKQATTPASQSRALLVCSFISIHFAAGGARAKQQPSPSSCHRRRCKVRQHRRRMQLQLQRELLSDGETSIKRMDALRKAIHYSRCESKRQAISRKASDKSGTLDTSRIFRNSTTNFNRQQFTI